MSEEREDSGFDDDSVKLPVGASAVDFFLGLLGDAGGSEGGG
jgi:hypothetical protein